MAKSARQDLFDALYTVYAADANKLGAGTVDKGARDFLMEGADLANRAMPYIFVQLTEVENDTTTNDNRSITVVMHLRTEPDRSISEQETIADQIRDKFNGVSLTGTDWVWSGADYLGADFVSDIGGTPSERHLAVRFRALGSRGSLVKPARRSLMWLAYTAGSGGDDLVEADCEYMESEAGVSLEEYRVLGERYKRYGPGESGASFVLTLYVRAAHSSDTIDTIPLGIMGTLTIGKDAGDTTKGYITGSAMLSTRRHVAAQNGWQTYRYTGRWSGEYTEV